MTRIAKYLIFTFFLSGLYTTAARAQTINAASCSASDVQTAINAAAPGDTVTLPACSQTNWTSTVTINVGITLQGAGQGVTIIGDNVNKGGASCSGGAPAFSWKVPASQSMRMTGLTVVGVSTDPGVCQDGHIAIAGGTHTLRIDHITINPGQTVGILIQGDIWGLIDDITWTSDFHNAVRIEHLNWNGFSKWDDTWGDASWNTPIVYGGASGAPQGIYIENSTFTNTDSTNIGGVTDCFSGGRLVFRYNTVTMYNNQSHGADSDQRHRACRWQEIYNNTYTYSNISDLAFISWIRGGTGVFYNNTITAAGYSNKIVQVANCRDASAGCGGGPNYTPWGACNGSSSYDQDSSGGYRCVDQPGAGTSNLLGPDPSGTITPANTWVGNSLDPVYVWGNTLNGSSNNTTSGTTNVASNRDSYAGIARPGYTAYTYPYPLTGSGSSVAAPTNLVVTVQ